MVGYAGNVLLNLVRVQVGFQDIIPIKEELNTFKAMRNFHMTQEEYDENKAMVLRKRRRMEIISIIVIFVFILIVWIFSIIIRGV